MCSRSFRRRRSLPSTACLNIPARSRITGKTSFLRLLLDTSDIAPSVTKEQLASVAKFVQGCGSHTSYIRSATIDIDLDLDGPSAPPQTLGLTLIDTPSLDFSDEQGAERVMQETLHHVDSRFADGMAQAEVSARPLCVPPCVAHPHRSKRCLPPQNHKNHGFRYVHLYATLCFDALPSPLLMSRPFHSCIYFLDPDRIVPPSVSGPPAPVVPRTRNGSFSQPDQEPVILEPPVVNSRAALPQSDITAIRRLSGRVNVLPVIARADILNNDRLAAVKVAVRRDLAEAGIGFGIFDMDSQYPHLPIDRVEPTNGYTNHTNGASTSKTSPPTSPVAVAGMLRLPYALISPDIYSHSDGVPRKTPSRHELIQQYSPPQQYPPPPKISLGKFIRSYRWGTVDVLDRAHSDFLSLRHAIFHHMEVSILPSYSLVCVIATFLTNGSISTYRLYRNTRGNTFLRSSKRNVLPTTLPLLVTRFHRSLTL